MRLAVTGEREKHGLASSPGNIYDDRPSYNFRFSTELRLFWYTSESAWRRAVLRRLSEARTRNRRSSLSDISPRLSILPYCFCSFFYLFTISGNDIFAILHAKVFNGAVKPPEVSTSIAHFGAGSEFNGQSQQSNYRYFYFVHIK